MPPPQQLRAIETRERILSGAAKVFSAKGYEGATVADILRVSGVTKGSLYFHFDSKESLGRAIVVRQTEMVSVVAGEDSGSAAQQLVDASFAYGRALQTDELFRASVRMTTEGHGFDAEQRIAFDGWLSFVVGLSTRAVREGSVRERWTPLDLARTLTAAVNGLQQSSLIYSGHADLLDRLTVFWDMIGPGLFTARCLRKLHYPTPHPRRSVRGDGGRLGSASRS